MSNLTDRKVQYLAGICGKFEKYKKNVFFSIIAFYVIIRHKI